MTSKLLYTLVVALMAIAFSQVTLPFIVRGATYNDTETFNVSITVGELAAIDVNPNSTNFDTINPGEASGDVAYIQIENIGSVNIVKIWANATMASSNPYGTGQPSAYNAGDFVLITNDSSEARPFYYVNSIFFNESKPPYISNEPSNYAGFMRIRTVNFNGTGEGEEYFTFVVPGTGGNCSNGNIYIGKTPHTKTQTGTINFGGSDVFSASLTPNSDYTGGYTQLSGFGSKLDKHYVYVNASCDYIILYRWNIDLGGGDYLFQGTLKPGETLDWKIEARVPYGVAAGAIQEGMITFMASSV